MKYLTFFIYQLILFSAAIAIDFFSRIYIDKTFNFANFCVIGLNILIVLLIVNLFNRFSDIRLLNKIVLTVLAFVSAAIFIGITIGEIIF